VNNAYSHMGACRIRGLVLANIFLAAILGGCRTRTAPSEPLTPVRLATADIFSDGQGPRYSASVVAYAQVDLAFQSGGYIVSIKEVRGVDGRVRKVQQGDFVTSGTVLAVVQPDDYQDKLNLAKANLAKAQADMERAKLSFDRTAALYGQQSATKPEYDDTKAQYDAGVASVQGAEANLANAQTALDYCSLKSPMDGWILNRNVDVGSLVGPATNGFSIVDTHLVKVVFGVPDISISLVRLGSKQSVTLDAVPGTFEGHITSISPSADPKSRVYSVEITIPNPDNKLRAGMIATLQLPGAMPTFSSLAVPLSAVVRPATAPEGFSVFVFEGTGDRGIVHRHTVQLGGPYGNLVAVTAGLSRGERVVTSGATLVQDGDAVQVIQ
jgi:RND family efflux transporter MFP subunit